MKSKTDVLTIEAIERDLSNQLKDARFTFFMDPGTRHPRQVSLEKYTARMAGVIFSYLQRRSNGHKPTDEEIFKGLRDIIEARFSEYNHSITATMLKEIYLGQDVPWRMVREFCGYSDYTSDGCQNRCHK